MTPDVLERQLLAFVSDTLLRGSVAVDADSRLFEDGYIDSLRVLELIAFLERTTGRKVPDRMVRLSTFRSVRTIAATFANGAEHGQPDSERLHEYRSGRTAFASPIAGLRARGDLVVLGDEGVTLRGTARELMEYFDAAVVGFASELGAAPRDLPSRIPLATLERAQFTDAFPHLLVRDDDAHALTPAVCYHTYPEHAGRPLARELVTCVRAQCHRHERETLPLERQRAFTMREIVVFGTRRGVERMRQRLVRGVGRWVNALALDGVVETADDPFFTAGDGRRLVQRAGALKLELRLSLEAGRSLAVASFNHHHDHFGTRFGITLADGTPAHSGCIAFGLERWVLAFLTQHGLDETPWPETVRAWLRARRSHVGPA